MTCFTWNCSPSMPSMAARAYITQIKQKFSCHSKHQQQNPKVLRLLLPSRLSLKSCTISFSHLCRSRTWQKQILATKTVLKVTNHSACNSMLLQKISKIPSLVVASIPKLPQCHHTFWTFVRDPGTMITPWICWKTYSCTERSWQDKCEYPWIFRNTLNFNAVILFFHDSKKRGSLELWEGAGLCVSSHQFILKKSNEFYCKKYPKFKTPPSRGQSPCQGCPHKSCHFWSKRWCCPWKGHIHLWKSAITS